MKLSRRGFLGALVGAACTVLGTVYGAPTDDEDGYWKPTVKPYRRCTQEELEAPFHRYYELLTTWDVARSLVLT